MADMLLVTSGVRYAVFLLSGKVFFALVVGTNFEQNQEIKNTS